MSEMKWTRGPWIPQAVTKDGDERGSAFIVADNLGGLVGAAHAWPTEIDEENFARVEANAKLIAAAPELYDALEELLSEWFDPEDTGTQDNPFVAKARRALAKARGEKT